jgi:multiple sugar transport system substrate-binding protein
MTTTRTRTTGRSLGERAAARRSTVAVAAGLVAVVALAGCGREEDDAPAAAAEEVTSGPATGTIDVWAMGTEGELLGDFVKAFEEANPDADVKVTAVPWDAAHDKIINAIAAGETPDVSLIGTTWMGEFAETGGLEPTPTDLVDQESFFPGAWESTVVDDTSYGVPWYVETRVLFYRTDFAEQAGWTEPPRTWDELHQFATDLQEQGGAEQGLYLQPGQTGSWQTFMPFAWQNGATLTNEEGTEYTLDSDAMAEALEYYKTYFTESLSQDALLIEGELEQGFVDGKFGSFISGPWHVGLVEEAGGADFADKFAVTTLPGKDDAPGMSFIGGGNLGVFADSDNRDAAWKLVQWLSQPETQIDWYKTIGDLPSVRGSWNSGELADDPMLSVFGEQLDHASSPPSVPTWEQVAAVIDADIEKAVKDAVSVEDAVADMQSQASSIGTGLE